MRISSTLEFRASTTPSTPSHTLSQSRERGRTRGTQETVSFTGVTMSGVRIAIGRAEPLLDFSTLFSTGRVASQWAAVGPHTACAA